ncbi:MAG: hypothetical protein WC760_05485 [Bacteroidia bacterium]|jgi:hypothetical protein
MHFLRLLTGSALLLQGFHAGAQGCCSGGSGSPIAGGVSQGVLQNNQMEFALSHQYFGTDRFLAGDKDSSSPAVNRLETNYLYLRMAYGVTAKLTMSVEAGYFLNKTEYGNNETAVDYKKNSSGIADLILFPRYDVYDHSSEKYHTEVTLGLGLKIPLGSCNDSTFAGSVLIPGQPPLQIYYTSPPTIQTTTGSNDLILYGFMAHEFKKAKFRVFLNTLYMHKGYNKLGQKFGDYMGAGFFVSKTFRRKLNTTLQLRYEWTDQMQSAKNVDQLTLYNVDLASTGSRKWSLLPQLGYTYKGINLFGMYEIPLYQYMQGFQIGTKTLITVGISYRFAVRKTIWKATPNTEE